MERYTNTSLIITESLTSMFRSWWFDPLVASIGFFASIMIYTHFEFKEGKSSYKSWREFLWGKGIDHIDARPSLNMSLFAYWVGVLIWVNVVPPPTLMSVPGGDNNNNPRQYIQHSIPDGIPTSISSLSYLLLEVVSGILLYDAIIFFIHLAMHECPYIAWLTKHSEHHKATKNLEARHVLRHSLIDGSLQVLVNIFVQRYTPWGYVKSRFARVLHNLIVTMMLTESHSASSNPNLFKWWCVGVREHRNHHLGIYRKKESRDDKGKLHYHNHRFQQFFGHWDYLWELYLSSTVKE